MDLYAGLILVCVMTLMAVAIGVSGILLGVPFVSSKLAMETSNESKITPKGQEATVIDIALARNKRHGKA